MALSGVTAYFVASDGQQWATYICDKLTEYSIKTDLCEIKENENVTQNLENLSVFFITPDFLYNSTSTMLETFDKDKSLLVLTGTDYRDIEAKGPSYSFLQQWNIHELSNSPKSVNDLFVMIIGLYECHEFPSPSSTPERPASFDGQASTERPVSAPDMDENDPYDQLPFDKKARQVNSVFDVMFKDGTVYLLLDRRAEGRLTVSVAGHHVAQLRHEEIAVYAFPYKESGVHNVDVSMDSSVIGKTTLSVPDSDDNKTSDVKETSSVSKATQTSPPPTMKKPVRPPSTDRPPSQSDLSDKNGGKSLAEISKLTGQNKLDILREILEEETDPICLMCKCFGIDKNDKQLDEKLAILVESSAAFSHVAAGAKLRDSRDDSKKTKWPTLFHFAARYNLTKFCQALLTNRLLYEMCLTKNTDGRTAGDLAKEHGHDDLALTLKKIEKKMADEVAGKYDSGYMRDSFQDDQLPPPAPHIGYTNITLTDEHEAFDTIDESDDDELEYYNKDIIEELSSQPWRCSGSSDGQPETNEEAYIQMAPKPHYIPQKDQLPVPCEKRSNRENTSSPEAPPFGNLAGLTGTSIRYKTSAMHRTDSNISDVSGTSMKSASSQSDIGDGPLGFKHKNLAEHLGMSWTPSTPEPQKKQHKIKAFFSKPKKKGRSNSEPNLPSEAELQKFLSRRKNSDIPKSKTDSTRTTPTITVQCVRSSTFSGPHGPPNLPPRHYLDMPSNRSGKTDSGSSSSSSNSANLEINEVELRGDQKSNNKLNFFKKTAKRKSMRLTKALKDQGDKAPSLPPRRYNEVF